MEFEGLMKSDIFFFVTTISVVVLTILAIIFGVYAIKIVRDIKSVSKDIKLKYKVIQKFISYLIK